MTSPLRIATFFVTCVGPLCDFLGGSLRRPSLPPRISSIPRGDWEVVQNISFSNSTNASVRRHKTSRVLNDQAYFLGLSYGDITAAGIFLLALLIIGKALGIHSMLWALALTIGLLFALIPIRMRFRRKIIRDSFFYVSTRGVFRVSKNRRV